MEDREILLARGSKRDITRHEILISLLRPQEQTAGQPQSLTATARAFLAQYVPLAVLEVFLEWQGMLVEVPALEGAVWIVRDPQYGRQLARETGKPAILLEVLLAQQGPTLEETREALAPLLIIPTGTTALRTPSSTKKERIQKT